MQEEPNFCYQFFTSNNSRENHAMSAKFSGAISLGFAIGMYIRVSPTSALITLLIGTSITAFKAIQAAATPSKTENEDDCSDALGQSASGTAFTV